VVCLPAMVLVTVPRSLFTLNATVVTCSLLPPVLEARVRGADGLLGWGVGLMTGCSAEKSEDDVTPADSSGEKPACEGTSDSCGCGSGRERSCGQEKASAVAVQHQGRGGRSCLNVLPHSG